MNRRDDRYARKKESNQRAFDRIRDNLLTRMSSDDSSDGDSTMYYVGDGTTTIIAADDPYGGYQSAAVPAPRTNMMPVARSSSGLPSSSAIVAGLQTVPAPRTVPSLPLPTGNGVFARRKAEKVAKTNATVAAEASRAYRAEMNMHHDRLKVVRDYADTALHMKKTETAILQEDLHQVRIWREIERERADWEDDGKTGTRMPLVVSATPHLSRWLRIHPARASRFAPLWIGPSGRQMPYWTIAKMLKVAARRAGIAKGIRPHLLRHSRVTYVLANGIMNEQQAKLYFGWTADSRTLGSTYAHLIAGDANAAVLRENGFVPTTERREALRPRCCRTCGELNTPDARACEWCNANAL